MEFHVSQKTRDMGHPFSWWRWLNSRFPWALLRTGSFAGCAKDWATGFGEAEAKSRFLDSARNDRTIFAARLESWAFPVEGIAGRVAEAPTPRPCSCSCVGSSWSNKFRLIFPQCVL